MHTITQDITMLYDPHDCRGRPSSSGSTEWGHPTVSGGGVEMLANKFPEEVEFYLRPESVNQIKKLKAKGEGEEKQRVLMVCWRN